MHVSLIPKQIRMNRMNVESFVWLCVSESTSYTRFLQVFTFVQRTAQKPKVGTSKITTINRYLLVQWSLQQFKFGNSVYVLRIVLLKISRRLQRTEECEAFVNGINYNHYSTVLCVFMGVRKLESNTNKKKVNCFQWEIKWLFCYGDWESWFRSRLLHGEYSGGCFGFFLWH